MGALRRSLALWPARGNAVGHPRFPCAGSLTFWHQHTRQRLWPRPAAGAPRAARTQGEPSSDPPCNAACLKCAVVAVLLRAPVCCGRIVFGSIVSGPTGAPGCRSWQYGTQGRFAFVASVRGRRGRPCRLPFPVAHRNRSGKSTGARLRGAPRRVFSDTPPLSEFARRGAGSSN